MVVFKHFDDKRAEISEDITVDTITELVNANKLPLVVYFSEDVSFLLNRY